MTLTYYYPCLCCRFHEKESLRRMVREATSAPGVLYAFIVLDNPANSILDMQVGQGPAEGSWFVGWLGAWLSLSSLLPRDGCSVRDTCAVKSVDRPPSCRHPVARRP